jgi:hypothetical protein
MTFWRVLRDRPGRAAWRVHRANPARPGRVCRRRRPRRLDERRALSAGVWFSSPRAVAQPPWESSRWLEALRLARLDRHRHAGLPHRPTCDRMAAVSRLGFTCPRVHVRARPHRHLRRATPTCCSTSTLSTTCPPRTTTGTAALSSRPAHGCCCRRTAPPSTAGAATTPSRTRAPSTSATPRTSRSSASARPRHVVDATTGAPRPRRSSATRRTPPAGAAAHRQHGTTSSPWPPPPPGTRSRVRCSTPNAASPSSRCSGETMPSGACYEPASTGSHTPTGGRTDPRRLQDERPRTQHLRATVNVLRLPHPGRLVPRRRPKPRPRR